MAFDEPLRHAKKARRRFADEGFVGRHGALVCAFRPGSAVIRWVSAPSPSQRRAAVRLAKSGAAHISKSPTLPLALAKIMGDGGEPDYRLELLEGPCQRFPAHEALHAEYANALARSSPLRAIEIARRWPDRPWAAKLAFKLLLKEGRFDEAASLECSVAAMDPADASLFSLQATRLVGDPKRLLVLAEAALAHDPGASHANYIKAVALAQLGRFHEASSLMAIERFVRIAPLRAPDGFGGNLNFHARVKDEILSNPTLHPDPAGHATRCGLRTRGFPNDGDRATVALIHAIRDAIGRYAATLAGDHPFVRARPERATFTPWALVFPAAGHQALHHHPARWLTGVYYVSGPNCSDDRGALRIGTLPAWADVDPPWRVLDVKPVPGRLVLFPSFVPHETLPTGSDDVRISVAFDVAAQSDATVSRATAATKAS